MVLENINWKEFRVGDLFDAESGNTDIKKRDINGKGYPVISSGVANQGLIGYSDIESKIHNKDTITVDMFGNVFYRDFDYKMVTHARVFALIPKRKINPRIGNFLVTCILKITDIFEYSYMCSYNKLKDMTILLPATQTGEPDWGFMEDYISEIEKEYLEKIDRFFIESGLDDYELTDEDEKVLRAFENIGWEEFRVGDLFEVSTTKGFNKTNLVFRDNGECEFIGRTSSNNGIQGRLHKTETEPNSSEVFSLVQIGENVAIWREVPWYASQNIFMLIPKFDEIKRVFLFLKTVIDKAMTKYDSGAYSYYPTKKTLKDDTILLPVREDGQPDWEFMEKYIKVIEKIAAKDAVEWKNSELKALQETAG